MADDTTRTLLDDILDGLAELAAEHDDLAEELALVRRYLEQHRDLLDGLPEEVIEDLVHAVLIRARGGVGALPPVALTPDEINQALRENADKLDRLLEKRRKLTDFVDGLARITTTAALRLLTNVATR